MRRLAAIAAFGLTACGAPNAAKHQLEGSLTQVMDLGYDEARVSLTDLDVSLLFVRKQSALEDSVLKVTWAKAGQELNTPSQVDLAEPRPDNGAVRGTLSRDVRDDPRRLFPDPIRGKMIFFDRIQAGGKVHTKFNVTFENGTTFASGRTVFGELDATVTP